MLPAGTAEALQRVAGHVITASDRNFLDGVGHLLNRNLDKAFCYRLGASSGLPR